MATRVNAILMRGLAGNIYSRGMDALGAKLAKLPNVDYISVEDYKSWRSIRDRIVRFRDPTIFGGCHSFGANAALRIARELDGKLNIPLICTVDSSQYWSWSLLSSGPGYVPMNVKKVLNMYQTSGLIGRQMLYRVNGTTKDIRNLPVNSSHTAIDDLPLVHNEIIAAVKAL